MTGPDSAGRPNKSAEDLAREGIGFQMSAFEWSGEGRQPVFSASRSRNRGSASRWCSPPTSFTATGRCFRCRSGPRATFIPPTRVSLPKPGSRRLFTWAALDVRAHGRSSADQRGGRVVETFGESPLVTQRLCGRDGTAAFMVRSRSCPENRRPRISVSRVASSTTSAMASPGWQGLRLRRSHRAKHPRVSMPPLRGRHRSRCAFRDAGLHHRPRWCSHVGETVACSRRFCAANWASTGYSSPTTPASRKCAITARQPTISKRPYRRCEGTMTIDMEDGVYYAQLARAVKAGRLRVD